jgi:ABC-2 type transport system permease protein
VTVFLRTLRSEFLKIFSTRLWWVLALIMVCYVALIAGGAAALFGALGDRATGGGPGAPVLGHEQLPRLIYSFGTSIGYVFPILLGALSTTGEFRHQTLSPTFLAVPRRGVVLGGKLVTLIVLGALFGALAMIASIAAGGGVLAAFGIDPQFGTADIWLLAGRAVIAMALWSAIGVGLGVLVPSQVAAIVIVLAFTQFVEPLLRFATAFVDWAAQIGKFLPGAASDALVGASFFTISTPASASLEWWQGGLVLLAIALVAGAIGYFTSWKRDVT